MGTNRQDSDGPQLFHGTQSLKRGMENGSVSTYQGSVGSIHLIPGVRPLVESRGEDSN